MDWKAVTMVEVDFKKDLSVEDLQVVEVYLRTQQNIDSLTVHAKRITFYIWDHNEINVGMLSTLKEKLTAMGYTSVEITAKEYKETDVKRI